MTHHIGLVISKASYFVEIQDGSVQGMTAAARSGLGSSGDDHVETIVTNSEDEVPKPKDREAAKFVQDEKRNQGRVSPEVYADYVVAAGGYTAWTFILMSFIMVTAATLGRSYWVELWSKATEVPKTKSLQLAKAYFNVTETSSAHVSRQNETVVYLSIYLGISLLTVILTGVKVGATMVASLRASRILFEELTRSVLGAQVRWLDTTPVGRILNRFVGDFEKVIQSDVSPNMDAALIFTGGRSTLTLDKYVFFFSTSQYRNPVHDHTRLIRWTRLECIVHFSASRRHCRELLCFGVGLGTRRSPFDRVRLNRAHLYQGRSRRETTAVQRQVASLGALHLFSLGLGNDSQFWKKRRVPAANVCHAGPGSTYTVAWERRHWLDGIPSRLPRHTVCRDCGVRRRCVARYWSTSRRLCPRLCD